MTLYTKPRTIPANCVRRGDEVAFAPGIYDGPISDADHATDERVRWLPVAKVRAGSYIEPWLIEFDGGHGEEFGRAESVVVRIPADQTECKDCGAPLTAGGAAKGERFCSTACANGEVAAW